MPATAFAMSSLPSSSDALAVKCPQCRTIVLARQSERTQQVCPTCDYHFRLTATQRLDLLLDAESFVPLDADLISTDPLGFVSQGTSYADKLRQERERLDLSDAVRTGLGRIQGLPLALGVMDFRFIGGSMGVVVGEQLTRLIETALLQRLPLLLVTASGGARMQEGLYSLMQMAKTAAALARFSEAGLPSISLLTDPTTGGVTASFAMLADIILAEPGALICFAGPRVIEQFLHEPLPQGAVRAEWLWQQGLLDQVVPRSHLRSVLTRLLHLYRDRIAVELPARDAEVSLAA